MRKCLVLGIIALLLASFSYAAAFAPEVMVIDVPEMVSYDFDGSSIEIPFTIAGQGGAFWLVITTKDKGAEIGSVRNGMLGWHTVNGIDTTVFVSGRNQRSIGDAVISWDGMSDARNGGGQVQAGTYNYFVYGYDDSNDRIIATKYIGGSPPWDGTYTYPIENDANGNPLSNPIIVGSRPWYVNNALGEPFGVHYRWALGADPEDANALQSTICPEYADESIIHGPSAYHPQDLDVFFNCPLRYGDQVSTVFKYAFVANGNAIRDDDFLGWDEITWTEMDVSIGKWTCAAGCYTDGYKIWINASNSEGVYNASDWNVMRCVSFDGEILVDQAQIPDYFMPDDNGPQNKNNCQIRDVWARAEDEYIMMPTGCCLHEMINAKPMFDGDDPIVLWGNGNGDFYMDIQWQPDAEVQWACINNPEYVEQRTNSVCIDKNGFAFIDTEYGGMVNGGVSCPDGFSIGMIKWADMTIDNAHHKSGTTIIDSGSNFDGYYTGAAAQQVDVAADFRSYEIPELYFIATDSDAGVITSEPIAVDEDDQVAFAVDQNNPNPFNPTTTIGFTIPEDANVTVDVFNVAGQKVDSLTDDFMTAGHHNVTWDAAGFSNGVYFYTVKAGEFAQTMKMTLLK